MLIEFFYKYPKRALSIGIILLVILAAILWWNMIWQNPQRVFEGMLANNLSTSSVTKYASATSGSEGIKQYVRLQMGSTNASTWLVTVTQTGSIVTTESIGTPSAGYIRYTDITTSQKRSDGKPFDFSSILNVWGKSSPSQQTSLNQLFAQTLLDISSAPLPPIGNLPIDKQQNILQYMLDQKVFAPSYSDVKREKVDGKSVYTYKVSVNLGAYVRMMQAFAHDVGQNSLDSVDPNQYSTAKPIDLSISVDRMSHQLVEVTEPSNNFEQKYSDWGLDTPTSIPTQTIPVADLQKRFQKLE